MQALSENTCHLEYPAEYFVYEIILIYDYAEHLQSGPKYKGIGLKSRHIARVTSGKLGTIK